MKLRSIAFYCIAGAFISLIATAAYSQNDTTIFAIEDNGDLVYYGKEEGTSVETFIHRRVKIGSGWDVFDYVFAGDEGEIYAVESSGDLKFYKLGPDLKIIHGRVKIGSGWDQFDTLFGGQDGVIYGINSDGQLKWYKHEGHVDGTPRFAPNSGDVIGTGWGDFDRVFGGANGSIYAEEDGNLVWYQHLGREDGSARFAANPRQRVPNQDWDDFDVLFTDPSGSIFAVNDDEKLLVFSHLNARPGGAGTDAGQTLVGPFEIGTGWGDFDWIDASAATSILASRVADCGFGDINTTVGTVFATVQNFGAADAVVDQLLYQSRPGSGSLVRNAGDILPPGGSMTYQFLRVTGADSATIEVGCRGSDGSSELFTGNNKQSVRF